MRSYRSVIYLTISLTLITGLQGYAQEAKKEKKKGNKQTQEVKAVDPKFNYYFFNGLKDKSLENFDNALQNFNQCIELDPTNDAVLFEVAKIYVGKGSNAQALEMIEKAVKLNPDQEWYLQLQAQLYEETNKQGDAAKTYKHLLELYPDRVEFFFKLANAYIFDNKFSDALKVYDKLEVQIGVTEDVSIQKQKIYLKENKVEKAVAEVDKLINQNPTDVRYYMMAGEILMDNKLIEEAMKYYQKALKIEPDNGYLVLAMSDYYRMKKDEANAYAYVKRAFGLSQIDIDTKVRILYPFFGSISKPDYYKQALELCEIMIATHPNEAKAHAMFGDFLAQKEESQNKAIAQYRRAVKLDGNIYAIWDQLVRLEISQKELDSASMNSDAAITLFPNQTAMYFLGGVAKAQLGKNLEAIAILKKGVNIGSANKALLAEMYSSMGDTYHELNQLAASDSAYDQALSIEPNQAYVLNNYSYYLSLRNERLEKAEQMSKKSLDIDPKNASFLDTYGWILYKLNRLEEAKDYIEKSIAAGGGSAAVMEHYGDILFKLGQAELALDNWKKAKDAGGKSPFLDKKIADKKLYE